MSDLSTARPLRAAEDARSLRLRRTIFALVAVATMAGLLCLACIAFPPRSVAALGFIALFAITLPWTVAGCWNAAMGFPVMRLFRDPVATVNPLVNATGVAELL